MSITKNIFLLGATFGTKNMGVNALTMGAIQAIVHQFPECHIQLLDYGKAAKLYNIKIDEKDIAVKLVNLRFSKKIFQSNHVFFLALIIVLTKLVPVARWRKKIREKNPVLRQLLQSDIFASISAGDSFSDIYGMKRFFYITLPQILVILLGKELVLLPQTIGPFRTKIAHYWSSYILNNASLVYSRDFIGLDELKQQMGKKFSPLKYKFCYDLGFILKPTPTKISDTTIQIQKSNDIEPLIGLNVSGLLFMGGYNRNNMFGLKTDYRMLIKDIIEHLIGNLKMRVLLVPHVFGTKKGSESDQIACKIVYDELGQKYKENLFLIRDEYNQSQIKYIIGCCHFFIGSRMHSCIAALSQSVPAVSIAYSKKFLGVMQSINFESLVADPRELSTKEIISVIDQKLAEREPISEKLKEKNIEIQRAVLNIFEKIQQNIHPS